jgi:hypothetical protein
MDNTIFRAMADTYESVQKVRIRAENQLRAIEQASDEYEPERVSLNNRLTDIIKLEGDLQKDMLSELKHLDIWNEFLIHVKGVGKTLSCKLIALPVDWSRDLSSIKSYFGMTPVYWKGECVEGHKLLYSKQPVTCFEVIDEERNLCVLPVIKTEFIEKQSPKRIKGWKGFWNNRGKTLLFLISEQFVKQGKYYRGVYDSAKQREIKKGECKNDMHIHLRAKRTASMMFLSHYHQAINELEGKEIRKPYQFEYLKHENFISWQDVVIIEKQKIAV